MENGKSELTPLEVNLFGEISELATSRLLGDMTGDVKCSRQLKPDTNANLSNPVHFRIVDTNVPLTAAGYNDAATAEDCRIKCLEFLERVFSGEIAVVIDGMNEALGELARNVPSRERSDSIAGRFLIHLFNNIRQPSYSACCRIEAKTPSGEICRLSRQ